MRKKSIFVPEIHLFTKSLQFETGKNGVFCLFQIGCYVENIGYFMLKCTK